jgi:hypothetical protein
VPDNSSQAILAVCIHRAASHARWLKAVIATHRKIVPVRVWIRTALDLSHAAPENIGRISILFVAGHNTTFTADALGHVEVETVLFSGAGRRRHKVSKACSTECSFGILRMADLRDGCRCGQAEGGTAFLRTCEQG